MEKMQKWSKTPQLSDLIRSVRKQCDYDNVDYPTLDFVGTVKLHGTNGNVSWLKDTGWHVQSRNNVIGIGNDNAGFANFALNRLEAFDEIKNLFECKESFRIYGEFAGKGIQQKVAITQLEKSFYIFAIEVDGEEINLSHCLDNNLYKDELIFNLFDFSRFTVSLNLKNIMQCDLDFIQDSTDAVDMLCPVSKELGVTGHGEGIVWVTEFRGENIRFKSKGESHTKVPSRQKRLKVVNKELEESLLSFEASANIEARCEQMYSEMFTLIGKEPEMPLIGVFIKAVLNDVETELGYDILRLGIGKLVGKMVSKVAVKYFKMRYNDV